MTDIDFDELDRAVSSLLGKPGEGAAPASPRPQPTAEGGQPAQPTRATVPADRPSAPSAPAKPSVSPASESSESAAQPSTPAPTKPEDNTKFPITPSTPSSTPPTPQRTDNPAQKASMPEKPSTVQQTSPTTSAVPRQPAIASAQPPKQSTPPVAPPPSSSSAVPSRSSMPRRSGRFMDVVHPSAQNSPIDEARKTQATQAQPAPAVSRVGRDIATPSATQSNTTDTIEAKKVNALSSVPKPPEQKEESTSASAKSAPVKSSTLSALFGKKSSTQQDEPLLTEKTQSHPETQAKTSKEEVSSPFLANAKVEKRPLGSTAATQPSDRPIKPAIKPPLPNVESEKDDQLDTTSLNAKNDTQQPASTVPPELKQDIVSIEASDTEFGGTERPDTPPALPPEKSSVKTAQSASQAAANTATLSIPQQYKAKQNQPDTTPRSIYDTDEYHKPLAAPVAKKKRAHPAVWILLTILLLAIGAGLGVAAYFVLG